MAQKRDHFHPQNFTPPEANKEEYLFPMDLSAFNWIVAAGKSMPAALHFCLQCQKVLYTSKAFLANALLSSLFIDTLIETDSPALALQACLTSAIRQVYYTWVPNLTSKATLRYFHSSIVQRPFHTEDSGLLLGL